MGFGTETLFVLVLGLLVLGPKRLHTILGHLTRAKAQLEEVTTVRLNVEKNQLVNVFGEFSFCIGCLKSA